MDLNDVICLDSNIVTILTASNIVTILTALIALAFDVFNSEKCILFYTP